MIGQKDELSHLSLLDHKTETKLSGYDDGEIVCSNRCSRYYTYFEYEEIDAVLRTAKTIMSGVPQTSAAR